MAQTLSVCIIAKNEEKYLETCLQALQTFDVEVVIADTGSTDRTKEIALKYTDKVYDFEWIGDFSAARNFVSSKAKHDHILALDCDEFIERLDTDEIEDYLKKNPFGVGMLKLTNIANSGTAYGKNIQWVPRIYDRRFVHFENRIHEQLRAKNKRELQAMQLHSSAIHMGYYQTEENRRRKQDRNIELLLLHLEEHPDDCYYLHQLAQSYSAIGENEKAYEIRKKTLALNPPKNEEYTELLVVGFLKNALDAGEYKEAMLGKDYYDALKGSPDFMFFYAQTLYANGMLEEAIKAFEDAIKLPPGHVEGSNTFFPYHALSVLYESMGEQEKAQEYEDMAQKYLKEAYNL